MSDRPTVLVVGGTGFLGSWLTRAAVDAECAVTALSRGKTETELPPSVERLHADRNADLSALEGRTFDVVVDGAGYTVAQVDRLLDALGDGVGHYVFVSSLSAVDLSQVPVSEQAPGIEPADPDKPDYGEAKAMCERRIQERLGDCAAIVRPGLIGGPGDHTGRATYWARRAARGGPALAPGSPADILQLVDARDLAPFTVGLGLERETGVYNGVGHPTRWGDFLADLARDLGDGVEWHWAGPEVLEAHTLSAWVDLPAWVPAVGPFSGACQAERSRADAAGLFTRNPAATARDAWRWEQAHPGAARQPGLSAEREAEALATMLADKPDGDAPGA